MTVEPDAAAGTEAPGRRRRWRWLAIGLAVVVVVAVIAQFALLAWYPVARGPFGATLGGRSGGCEVGSGVDCTFVPFHPGRRIGVLFSVHNGGPLPITVESVDAFGTDLLRPLMTLRPRLLADPRVIGVRPSKPFVPLAVAPGADGTVILAGRVSDCATVADDWAPGSGLIVDRATITIRIGLLTRRQTIQFYQAMEVGAPDAGSC